MRVAVLGSGPSGVAAAAALLGRGHAVDIVDVGHRPEPAAVELAAALRDGSAAADAARRLQPQGGALSMLRQLFASSIDSRRIEKRVFGSRFAFRGVDQDIAVRGASPPRSLALGGLSNVWGTASYPLRATDYRDWPTSESDMAPWFRSAADMLGIWQSDDALSEIYPLYGTVDADRARNPGSPVERLLLAWRERGEALRAAGAIGGRSRLAVRPPGREDGCRACSLCLYGCPPGAMYAAQRSLIELRKDSRLRYRDGLLAERFIDTDRGVDLVVRSARGAERLEGYDALVLAAGALSSLILAADSLSLHDEPVVLCDNDLWVLPMLGPRAAPGFRTAFALSEAVLAFPASGELPNGAHVQLYAFHPYFAGALAPLLASRLAQPLAERLVLAFIYLHSGDSRHASAAVERRAGKRGLITMQVAENACSEVAVHHVLQAFEAHRHALGLRPVRALLKRTPFGFSGHLGGSLAAGGKGELSTDRNGRLHGTRRVYVADAGAFPMMPPQNPTLIAMANSQRVAAAL